MSDKELKNDLAFDSTNYRMLIIGVLVVIVGFILMSGGGSGDPTQFNEDEIFSFRRITLAPLTCLAGYMFIIYAIMRRPKAGADN